MSETVPNQRSNVDEIDFTAIFAIFWRHWKLILFGTLAVTLLAAVLSFFIPKTFRSEGFYQVSLSVPLYKKSAPQFSNPNRFYLYASEEKSFSKEDLAKIKTSFQTAADINKWIMPVFAYAKADMREMAQLPKEESNSVIGLNLSYEADSPQKAYNFVRFFGQYVRDCLLYVSLYDYVLNNYSNTFTQMNTNENTLFESKFNLLQSTKKMSDIKTILTKYPESGKIESRQLAPGFLGPVTQLVGIESVLADQQRTLTALEREKEMLLIKSEYFIKCKEDLDKAGKHGELMFSQLKSIKFELFKKKDFHKDVVKEVFNNLNNDLQTFDLAFFTNCRFISGPTFPDRHIKPRKSIIVIIACFLSFFFFMVLTLVLHWWQRNKKAILSDPMK